MIRSLYLPWERGDFPMSHGLRFSPPQTPPSPSPVPESSVDRRFTGGTTRCGSCAFSGKTHEDFLNHHCQAKGGRRPFEDEWKEME